MHTPPSRQSLHGRGSVVRGGQRDARAVRLRICAGRPARRSRSAELRALCQRWLDGVVPPPAASEAATLRVEVVAEAGRPLFALRDPQGTVEMTVGPGTYDITVVSGARKRRYTVTLEPGATFDLDLQDAMQAE